MSDEIFVSSGHLSLVINQELWTINTRTKDARTNSIGLFTNHLGLLYLQVSQVEHLKPDGT